MQTQTFGAAAAAIKQRAHAAHRRNTLRQAALLTIAPVFAMLVTTPELLFRVPFRTLAAFGGLAGILLTLVLYTVLLRRRPSGVTGLQRALASADVDTAIIDVDGALTFACADGIFVGPMLQLVPFDADRIRLESVAWTEDEHALLLQVWRLVRNRRTEREVITPVHVRLPTSVSSDDGLKLALSWNKLAWDVRHRGGPRAG